MSTIKSSAEDLTLNADGSGNDIKFQSNAVEKASLSDAGLLTTSGGASLDGAVTINETGADVDFRVESDTDANALFVDGSTGNVGIGTNDPNSSLTVEGDGARIGFSNTATYPCTSSISGFRSGTTCGNMYIETAGGGNFTTPVERIAIEGTGGEVRISTGDLSFGTAGKGIVLGSTTNVDANTLDDYEEGTWTPTGAGGVAGGITATDCYYTKIGRVVHVQGRMGGFNGHTSTTLKIEGLPYSVTYASNSALINGIKINTQDDIWAVWCYLTHGGTSMYFRNSYDDAMYSSMVGTDLDQSGCYIQINATYITE